jgi:WhiB family redox-sensing transcriptional regulator
MATNWRHRAVCRELDPELFFPISEDPEGGCAQQIKKARAVCERCPVRLNCLAEAVASGSDFGIWGGFTGEERRQLRIAEIQHARVS